MPARVGITGINGQVGRAISAIAPGGWVVDGTSSTTVDVRSWQQVRNWLATSRPQIVIHAAAMTDVDGCETSVDEAFAINALGSRHVARAAQRIGATFVYISTNFVFDGDLERPYHEFDGPNPISVYGASKLAGEREVLAAHPNSYIVRTAMVYDETGRNFMNTMRRLMTERDEISVVNDQVGNPTYAPDLARGLIDLLASRPPGIYHLTNRGSASWFDWALEVKSLLGLDCDVLPVRGADYQRAATPPANGALTSLAWPEGATAMPDWRDALRRCLTR